MHFNSQLLITTQTLRYPSPVTFLASSCVYEFHHPYEASVVQMTIYYKVSQSYRCCNDVFERSGACGAD
jgi:hypothetical protein